MKYNKDKMKFILDVKMEGIGIGFNRAFGGDCLRLCDIIYTREDYSTFWSSYKYRKQRKTNEQWQVWALPFYRLTKEVYTICDTNSDMSRVDMIKYIEAVTDKYGVKWDYEKTELEERLRLHSKPDPQKDTHCAIIHFNEATMNMFSLPRGYFQSKYRQENWLYHSLRYDSYKTSNYYGNRPMLMTIYSRQISNRSPFIPFRSDGYWNTLTFPRQQFTKVDDLLSYLKSFNPPDYAKVQFGYQKNANRFKIIVAPHTCLRIDPVICDILGFKQKEYFVGGTYIADYTPALDRAVGHLFIYSDIIENVFIGNVKAPLLCVMSHKQMGHGGSNSYSIPHPTYIPVKRQSFNQQRIMIMDDTGKHVSFANGKTVLLLHFRKCL